MMSGGQKVASMRPALPPPLPMSRAQLMSRLANSKACQETTMTDKKEQQQQQVRISRRRREEAANMRPRGRSVPKVQSQTSQARAAKTVVQLKPPLDTWSSLDDLFWEHMREVQNKWQTLKMNDDIWAKLIYFEQNRRLAKAYVSTPVLTIDGSTSGLDGFRIGLSGIENSYRSLDSIASLRSIGQGIKLKIDGEGNILVRLIGPKRSNGSGSSLMSNCSIWVKDWPPASADSSLAAGSCSSPLSSSSLSDSYTSADGTSSSSSASSTSGHYIENWNVKKLSCEYNDDQTIGTYKLFDMNKFRAQIERQRRQQQYSGSDSSDQSSKQLVDWRQCVSIICFVRNNDQQHLDGNHLTKQLLVESKTNRNPQRILREPCWIMLINIIAIDMLKSLLCDNKSDIRPALTSSMITRQNQQNNIINGNNRYDISKNISNNTTNGSNNSSTNKNSKFVNSFTQRSYERANSRILEHDNEDDENNILGSRQKHYNQNPRLHQIDPNSSSRYITSGYDYNQGSKVSNNSSKHATSGDCGGINGQGRKLKSSSSVASLHPSSGQKLRTSSSGFQLADCVMFPTGNIINYFSSGQKAVRGKTGTDDNFALLKYQSDGLSSLQAAHSTDRIREANIVGSKRTLKQNKIDQIYSKSDYIRFDAKSSILKDVTNPGSHQHLNQINYPDNYDGNPQLDDDDAIYTTFTGKYLYNNKNRSRRAQLDDTFYSTAAQMPSDTDIYATTNLTGNQKNPSLLGMRQSISSLYPMDSMTQQSHKIKSASLGVHQSRSSFDLNHGHKLDLRHLKTPTSIKINFDDVSEDEDIAMDKEKQSSNETTLKSRRTVMAFNKKASEWSRLARRFATSRKPSLNSAPKLPEGEMKPSEKSEQNCDSKTVLNQKKISRSSIVSSSSSSGCPENDYFLSQSSMSSSTSSERTSDVDPFVQGTNQPASSSGITVSGNTSDDYCGEALRLGGEEQSNSAINNQEEPSKKANKSTRDSRSRKGVVDNIVHKTRLRSVSRDRYNNVKILQDASIDCDHLTDRLCKDEQELECDCPDCGYQLETHHEVTDYSSCSCCCDCFLDDPDVSEDIRVTPANENTEATIDTTRRTECGALESK